jgi:ElaB/YqjD/DUF883 family membrane-anchored ribosome-binding protein
MPPRKDELPEGTDKIINGAMETNEDGGGGGGAGTGFIGSGARDDLGAGGTGGTAMTAGTGNEDAASGGVVEQLRGQAASLRGQAEERVRDFAQGGKARATDALEELSRVVSDTADSIDERLGAEYGEYARKASDAVANFADTLRRKEVDDLYDDVRDAVRKSPGIAIGIAAVVGFTLVRLIKAGLPDRGDNGAGGSSDRAGA